MAAVAGRWPRVYRSRGRWRGQPGAYARLRASTKTLVASEPCILTSSFSARSMVESVQRGHDFVDGSQLIDMHEAPLRSHGVLPLGHDERAAGCERVCCRGENGVPIRAFGRQGVGADDEVERLRRLPPRDVLDDKCCLEMPVACSGPGQINGRHGEIGPLGGRGAWPAVTTPVPAELGQRQRERPGPAPEVKGAARYEVSGRGQEERLGARPWIGVRAGIEPIPRLTVDRSAPDPTGRCPGESSRHGAVTPASCATARSSLGGPGGRARASGRRWPAVAPNAACGPDLPSESSRRRRPARPRT